MVWQPKQRKKTFAQDHRIVMVDIERKQNCQQIYADNKHKKYKEAQENIIKHKGQLARDITNMTVNVM